MVRRFPALPLSFTTFRVVMKLKGEGRIFVLYNFL
ncbi:unnamed protein product [Rhodiola kirilowii]